MYEKMIKYDTIKTMYLYIGPRVVTVRITLFLIVFISGRKYPQTNKVNLPKNRRRFFYIVRLNCFITNILDLFICFSSYFARLQSVRSVLII